MSQRRVSLVVPIRDEKESLPRLLRSIDQQTRPPDEIVLVDGGSTDGTVMLARQLTAGDARYRILEAGPATPGRGRNVGIAAATHDWIALTDAGIELVPGWLEQLVVTAEADLTLDVVFGNYEPLANNWLERAAKLTWVPPKEIRNGSSIRGRSTVSLLLRRNVWEEIGGFPDLRAAEDLIFMERMEQAGYRIGWAPQATARWRMPSTLRGTFRRFSLYSKHNVWAGRQRYWHYGVRKMYLLALPFMAFAILHSVWWLSVPILGLLARGLKSIWQRREVEQSTLTALLRLPAVCLLLVTIDLATFAGWLQAFIQKPASANRHAIEPAVRSQTV